LIVKHDVAFVKAKIVRRAAVPQRFHTGGIARLDMVTTTLLARDSRSR